MGLFKPNTRGPGEIERAVMNVMIDRQYIGDIGEAAGIEREQARGALERLQKRGLAMRLRPGSGHWALTHAGKRVVR
jgi:predicted transcriptional regulator of viral defense system